METITQLRSVCPICFREQAVREGRKNPIMVQHGYQRPEGWHANVGNCFGTNQPHFGTRDGLQVAKDEAKRLREFAARTDEALRPLKSGEVKELQKQKQIGFGRMAKYETVTVKLGDDDWVNTLRMAIYERERDRDGAKSAAKSIEQRCDAWVESKPKQVEVVKGGQIIHKYSPHMHGKACAGSRTGAQRGVTVGDWAEVNCARCLQRKAWLDQREAEKKGGAK